MMRIFSFFLLAGMFAPVQAASLSISMVDKNGAALPDGVVYAIPVGAKAPAASSETLTIAQQDREFIPHVTVARVGTNIKFPNYDKIEHHVKSFSSAKEFEIKVYDAGTPPPVNFDKAGTAIIYCMIHDWMRAYVLVIDTPYFAKTDGAGAATLINLPEGQYELKAWHPGLGTIKPELSAMVKVAASNAPVPPFAFDFVPRKRKMPKEH